MGWRADMRFHTYVIQEGYNLKGAMSISYWLLAQSLGGFSSGSPAGKH